MQTPALSYGAAPASPVTAARYSLVPSHCRGMVARGVAEFEPGAREKSLRTLKSTGGVLQPRFLSDLAPGRSARTVHSHTAAFGAARTPAVIGMDDACSCSGRAHPRHRLPHRVPHRDRR